MDPGRTSARVRELAEREGFEIHGIATLAPAATAGALRRWIGRGDQAGMVWMERHVDLRADPRRLLPGAKSALVVALPYAPLEDDSRDGAASPMWEKVARYARGADYHNLLRSRLGRIAATLEEEYPGTRSRVCVDTTPLLERELAARAGLGAIGKNTNLLHPRSGSWLLLAELLLTLELKPDSPIADLCGNCSRCLDACPTGALVEPYRLDSRRCLSYWTIEHRGDIPEDLRPHVAERMFGCDICQEVCPWNEDLSAVDAPDFAVPARRRALDLVALLGLGREAYVELFRRSPMKRAKLDGLRRNAALALAQETGPRARAALAEAARRDATPEVRVAAAWAEARRESLSISAD